MAKHLSSHHECWFNEEDGTKVAGVRWKNPDGSIGGWVAETAKIDPTATVEFTAFVGPGVTVGPGMTVQSEEQLPK